ncbi:hypothetical protein PV327_011447, partial [Microctonus hyperodae]
MIGLQKLVTNSQELWEQVTTAGRINESCKRNKIQKESDIILYQTCLDNKTFTLKDFLAQISTIKGTIREPDRRPNVPPPMYELLQDPIELPADVPPPMDEECLEDPMELPAVNIYFELYLSFRNIYYLYFADNPPPMERSASRTQWNYLP